MAITALGPFWIPAPVGGIGAGAPTVAFWNDLNAVNEAVAFIVRVPKTGTLNTAEFRLGSVGNTPDNGLKVSFQNLSGDFPDGVVDQFRDVTTGFTSNAWLTVGLITADGTDTGAKRSVTAGDYLAIVVEFVSFVAADNVGVNALNVAGNTQPAMPGSGQTYLAQRSTTSVWTISTAFFPQLGVQYDDGTWAYLGPTWYPYSGVNTATWNNTSTPDERGLFFSVTVSTRIAGMWFRGDNTAALDVVLYDSGGSALVTVSVDTAVDSATGGLNFLVPFPPTTLTANATYRLVVKPTSGSNVTLYDFDVPGNAYLSAVEGGIGWYYTERTDAGAWTDTNTKRPWMGILIDGVDVSSSSGGVLSAMWGAVGTGLMFGRAMVQYLAMAGPILIPAVAAPDLSAAVMERPVVRRPFRYDPPSPEIGQADAVVVPELCSILFDLPPVRRGVRPDTQSTEFGRSDPPPPAAPDLSPLIPADPVRRKRLEIGTVTAQTVLPPGYAPDWYPSTDYQIRRRRFLTHEAYARPSDKPTIPFDPQQQVATLPQPPLRPAAISARAALSTVPPVGPPSSALTPPGVTSWTGVPNQPPATARPRQGLFPAPQNLVPIPQNAPPELSWQPSAEVPPSRPSRRPWLEAFAQNIDPLNTPAYLASFWISYYPPGPFPKQGLLPALQQVFADAPPAVELQVVFGAWRPEMPAILLRAATLTPEAFTLPEEMTTLADAYGCISLNSVRVTQPTLLAAAVTGPQLLDVEVTSSTLLIDEVC